MSRRLLLVDDDEDIRTIAIISLERIGGWAVRAASGCQEALEAVEQEAPFDAVFLDVMMPGMDGPRTLQALRAGALDATVPIVFLTAKVAKTECQRLLALGAAGVMSKPFDPLTLSAGLDSILEPRLNSHQLHNFRDQMPTVGRNSTDTLSQ